MPEWYGELHYYRRAAQYLGTSVPDLLERLVENPLYEQIIYRAVEASAAEQEAIEDSKQPGRKG